MATDPSGLVLPVVIPLIAWGTTVSAEAWALASLATAGVAVTVAANPKLQEDFRRAVEYQIWSRRRDEDRAEWERSQARAAAAAVAEGKRLWETQADGAANDAEYGNGTCGPNCIEWRNRLNAMFHFLQQMELMPGSNPVQMTQNWWKFRMLVKQYEKSCGPYQDPPSFADIYLK